MEPNWVKVKDIKKMNKLSAPEIILKFFVNASTIGCGKACYCRRIGLECITICTSFLYIPSIFCY